MKAIEEYEWFDPASDARMVRYVREVEKVWENYGIGIASPVRANDAAFFATQERLLEESSETADPLVRIVAQKAFKDKFLEFYRYMMIKENLFVSREQWFLFVASAVAEHHACLLLGRKNEVDINPWVFEKLAHAVGDVVARYGDLLPDSISLQVGHAAVSETEPEFGAEIGVIVHSKNRDGKPFFKSYRFQGKRAYAHDDHKANIYRISGGEHQIDKLARSSGGGYLIYDQAPDRYPPMAFVEPEARRLVNRFRRAGSKSWWLDAREGITLSFFLCFYMTDPTGPEPTFATAKEALAELVGEGAPDEIVYVGLGDHLLVAEINVAVEEAFGKTTAERFENNTHGKAPPNDRFHENGGGLTM